MTELRKAWAELSKSASHVIPAAIIGEPDMADAKALVDDLEVLAKLVDRLVLAYGEYAVSHLGMSAKHLHPLFTNQLSNALEGNAMFEIEETIRDRIASREDTEADMRREMDETMTA